MKIQYNILLLILIAFSNLSIAAGNEFKPINGSKAFALNNLYFAGSPGLHSVLSNPAGLTDLKGLGIEISLSDNIISNSFDSPVRGLYKSYNEDNLSLGGGIYMNLSEAMIVSLSYLPQVDYLVDWPFAILRSSDTTTAMLAFELKNLIEVNSISPAIGIKFDNLSVGLAINILQVKHRLYLPQSNPNWPNGLALSAYQVNSEMDTWTFNGSLGLQYSVNEDIKLGLVYKHGFTANLEGTTESRILSEVDSISNTVSSNVSFEMPSVLGVGALYRLGENTTLNVDASYSLFGSLSKNMVYTFDNGVAENRFSQKDEVTGLSAKTISLNYENSIDAGIGFEYVSYGGFAYRGSYRYSQSPLPSGSLNYLFPSIDTHTLAIGVGFREEKMLVDASIAYTFGMDKEVTQEENTLYGKYYSSGYVPSITIRYEL